MLTKCRNCGALTSGNPCGNCGHHKVYADLLREAVVSVALRHMTPISIVFKRA